MSSRSLAALEAAAEKVGHYTDPARHFAFWTYDVQGDVDVPLSAGAVLSGKPLELAADMERGYSTVCRGLGS